MTHTPLGARVRTALLILLGMLAGVSLLGGFILLRGDDQGDQGAAPQGTSASASPSPSDPPDPPPTSEEQERIAQALNSADEALLEPVLSAVLRDAQQEGGPPVPAGTSVDVRWETFQLAPPGAATVTVVLSGSAPGTYTMVLVREEDTWRILAADTQS